MGPPGGCAGKHRLGPNSIANSGGGSPTKGRDPGTLLSEPGEPLLTPWLGADPKTAGWGPENTPGSEPGKPLSLRCHREEQLRFPYDTQASVAESVIIDNA